MGLIAPIPLNTIVLAGTLGAALAAMQAPTVTRDYVAALDEIAAAARQDCQSASRRRAPAITDRRDRGRPTFSRRCGKSEARGRRAAGRALERASALRADHERIATAPPLRRPLLAAWDVARDASGHQRAVAEIVVERSTPALHLDPASSLYAVAGVLLGSLVVQLLLGALGLVSRAFRPLRRRAPNW